jgi:hypothetical protein
MKKLAFTHKKGQSESTTITLPNGAECKFKNGLFVTEDPGTAAWLKDLGYSEYKEPKKVITPKKSTRKTTAAKTKGENK